jgi:hypothetical protein
MTQNMMSMHGRCLLSKPVQHRLRSLDHGEGKKQNEDNSKESRIDEANKEQEYRARGARGFP